MKGSAMSGEQESGKTVLVVEDDLSLRDLIVMTLEIAGYGVIATENGKVAIDRLLGQKPHPDFIIVDMMMPEMDGLGFLRWLRQEAGLSIPTLVHTSMMTEEMRQRIFEAGATALLFKPVKPQALLDQLKQLERDSNDPITN
jgi:two-component system, OmpR family, alkaline phosphatase synthesis response regulator PhoP